MISIIEIKLIVNNKMIPTIQKLRPNMVCSNACYEFHIQFSPMTHKQHFFPFMRKPYPN